MPKLSVCIPAYCQVEYLRETLLSVAEQSYKDYELIITDDTRDDSVMRLVDSFNFGERLRYIKNSTQLGSPDNWNKAVDLANGEYIKILHHDDRLSRSDSLECFVAMLDENPNVNFAFSATKVIDINTHSIRIHRPSADEVIKISLNPEMLFFGNMIGAPSATIYRNGLGLKYDHMMKWLVDVDFYIRVLQKNPYLMYTPEALIETPTNASHQVTEVCKNDAKIELEEHLLLYQKLLVQARDIKDAHKIWFRLFEKYQIFTQEQFDGLELDPKFTEPLLTPFFSAYQEQWISRLPFRIYARLPPSIRRIVANFRGVLSKR